MALPFKKFGYSLNPITLDIKPPQVFLVDKNLKKKGELYPLDEFTADINEINQPDEISFTYYKEVDDTPCPCFDDLTDLSVIQVGSYGFFEIAVAKSEHTSVVKKVTARSLGIAELSQIICSLEVNTEEDISRSDYDKNYPTVFYRDTDISDKENERKKKEEASLLDRVLSYAPHYHVGYVSPTLRNIQRTFSWSDTDIVSALNEIASEVNCVFDICVTIGEDGRAERTVNAYDIQYCRHCWEAIDENKKKTASVSSFRNIVNGVCQTCGSSEHIADIGQDTNIFISTDNLSDEISIEGDRDSIKNCFKVVGGDDTITAAVQGLNMSASNRIMMFSDEQKKRMSPELVEKLDAYDKELSGQSESYEKLLEIQYDLYDMILYLQSGKMPVLEEEITTCIDAILYVTKQIYTYYKNTFFISSWSNYGYTSAKYSISNLLSTFMPKGFSFSIDTDEITHTNDKNFDPSKKYCWYGSIKFYSSDNRENIYTLHVTGNNGSYITREADDNHISYNDSEGSVSGFSVTFNFADKSQEAYMSYIKQHTSYLLSEVDLNYDNEKSRTWNQYSYNRLESYYDGFQSCIDAIDGMRAEETTETSSAILNQVKGSYMGIQGQILAQMTIVKDQIFALCSYLGEFSDAFLDANGNINYELKHYTSISEALSHMTDTRYPNEFIGTKPYKCEKCSSTNVSELTSGKNICNNCGSYDIYSCYDVMKDIVDSYVDNQSANPGISIADMRRKTRAHFDIKTYFAEDGLYNELLSFIREDVYTNDNYTSDGLTNSQIISQAKELMAKARQELSKACTTQYTVTANISAIVGQTEAEYKDAIVSDDYSGFSLNNYVRVRIDGEIYKMRISSIRFAFPVQDKIDVTFTNVSRYNNGAMSDVSAIIDSASDMASSYNYVATQAEKGEAASQQFDEIKRDGLDACLMAVKGGRDQEVIIDGHGILLRKKIPELDTYSDMQMKIINRNIVLTEDNWETSKMAIGLGSYNGTLVYGVWADLIVGNLMITKNLKVMNEDSTVIIDDTGITLDGGAITWTKKMEIDDIDKLSDTLKNIDISVEEGISSFRQEVYNILTGGNLTTIGEDYVISPKIGGGYLYIQGDTTSVEINPAGTQFQGHDSKYVFSIKKKADVVMAVSNSGNGYFSGEVYANKGYIGGKDGWEIDSQCIKNTGDAYIQSGQMNSSGTKIHQGIIETIGFDKDSYKKVNLENGAIWCKRYFRSINKNLTIITSDVIEMQDGNEDVFVTMNSWENHIYFGTSTTSTQFYGTVKMTSSPAITSDKNKKSGISAPDAQYTDLFDAITIRSFKYNDGTAGRIHLGIIAQELEDAMKQCNIPSQNFAGLVIDHEGNYYVRYDEIHMLTALKVKQLSKEIDELKVVIDTMRKNT